MRLSIVVLSLIATTWPAPAHANPYESGGKVDEFVGAYTDSIPITVPPFHGIEPKLALEYHSGRGSGIVGVGWSLHGLSVIEWRDAARVFVLDGQQLVDCKMQQDHGANGLRSPACETNPNRTLPGVTGTSAVWFSTLAESYLRIEHGTDPADRLDTFVVWRPDGVRHFYKPATGNPQRWLLTRVVDTSGNTVTYNWVGPPATNYNRPTSIAYNGTVISFGFLKRGVPETSGEQGRLETIDETLGLVDICVNATSTATSPCATRGAADSRRARAYQLSYRVSTARSRPLLKSIQMFGKDAIVDGVTITGGTSAPAVTIGWTDPDPRWDWFDAASIWNWGRGDLGMIDFDGDGRADLCRDDSGNPAANMRCAMSRGTTSADTWIGQIDDLGNDNSGMWVDWNGDGKADYCRVVLRDPNGDPWDIGETQSFRLWCAFSTGTGLTDSQVGPPLPTDRQGHPNERWFVDWNGDGRTDFCRAVEDAFANIELWCAFSTGSSYTEKRVGIFDNPGHLSLNDVLGYPETRAMTDWNGDGRADLCRVIDEYVYFPQTGAIPTGRKVLKCLMGRVYEHDRDQLPVDMANDVVMGEIGDRGSANTQWWVDVNGDGKSDYCRLLGTSQIQCAISLETSLKDVLWASSLTKFGVAESRRWGDIDGDGRMDMCFEAPGAMQDCVLSNGLTGVVVETGIVRVSTHGTDRYWMQDFDGDGRADWCFNSDSAGEANSKLTCIRYIPDVVLAKAITFDNGVGGKTTVDYVPSSRVAPSSIKVPVTSTVTREGGAEGPATTSYSYSGPAYDAWLRRFLGFGTVRITDPCVGWETYCPSTEIVSRLGWRWPTMPAHVSRYADGALVHRRDLVYADTTLAPFRSDLLEETVTQLAGVDAVATKRTFAYDQYGNVTRLDDLGVITDSTGYFASTLATDDRSIVTTYFPNPDTYVMNKPAQITGSDALGKLTETRFVYDGNKDWQQMPSQGRPTRTEVWLDTTNAYLPSSTEYDGPGNVVSETDRNGNLTTYDIDTTYNQYVTKTTRAANLPAMAQSTSTPLAQWDVRCGQKLRETQDQSGTTTITYLDPLCRPIGTDSPGGGWETVAYVVGAGGTTTTVSQPGSRWRRTEFDGLGRVKRVVRSGTPNIVEKDVAYDKRGNIASAMRPYYLGDSVYGYLYTYDGQNRQNSAVMSGVVLDGKYQPGDAKYTRYPLMAAITTDAMGHAETTVHDVRDRRVFTGSSNGSLNPRDLTKYFYDRRGNLERIEQSTQQGSATALTLATYDSLGRKTQSADSDSGSRMYDYDANGNLISIDDLVQGVTTRYWYDAFDRRVTKIAPYCGKQACSDTVRVDWRYDEPRAGYFNVGKLTSMTDAWGTATYDYDAAGNLVRGGRTVDGSGPFTFTKQYDIGGRLLATTYPDGSTVGTATQPITYDSAGRISSIPGIVQWATYDAADQLTNYVAPSGAMGVYDTANPRGAIASYTFEGPSASGPVVVLGDFEGSNTASATTRVTEFAVSPMLAEGQVLTVSTCAAGVPGASGIGDTYLRLAWIPAAGSQLVEVASNDTSYVPGCGALSTITFRAPAAGTFYVRAGCAGNGTCSGTVAAAITNDGATLSLGKPIFASSTLDSQCGPASSAVDGNPDGVWCGSSSMLHTQLQPQPWAIIDLGSDQDIRRIDVFNRSDTNVCDATCLARLANFDVMVAADGGAGGWQTVAYVAEQAQRPTSLHTNRRARYVLLRLRGTNYLNTPEIRVVGPGPAGATLFARAVFERATITRDLEGRIARIDSNLARSSWRYTYSPDHTHELWSADNQGDPTLSKSSSSDNGNVYFDNRPQTYGQNGTLPHALTQFDAATYTYDNNGRMTDSPNGKLEWTRTGELVSHNNVGYIYDGNGYRLGKSLPLGVKIYLGDDYEISDAGHTKYISLGGRLVARQTGTSAPTMLFTDQLGSVVLEVGGNGLIEQKRSFGPWGETLTGDDEGRGYTGQYKDENGLLYLHARFYDPLIGRFVSPDPTISSPHPIGMNRYAYAFNDPINHSDIDGLGVTANVLNDLSNASGAAAQFLATFTIGEHLDYYTSLFGQRTTIKKALGGFNMGIGNTLALGFIQFRAVARGDGTAFAKATGSAVVIGAAIAISIITYGTAAAPIASFAVAWGMPLVLTMIETGDVRAVLAKSPEAVRGAFIGLGFFTLGRGWDAFGDTVEMLEWLRTGGAVVTWRLPGSSPVDPFAAPSVRPGILAQWSANDYVAMEAIAHATSIAPQSQLANGSGTLFGYGYRAAGMP